MFPMANVKEEIMTRIPRMGVNQEGRRGEDIREEVDDGKVNVVVK